MSTKVFKPNKSDLNEIFDHAHKIYIELPQYDGNRHLEPREMNVKSYYLAITSFLTRKGIQFNDSQQIRNEERARAVQAVMDLYYALRNIKGQPSLKDLVKLAKRIKR